jgi:pyruvate/2-oxoglutarate dehydrogenase complex dihydrolipoamide acyltransferase (E2) component
MNKQQKLHRNGTKVDTLYRAVRNSEALELIPALVRQIVEEEMWREHLFEKTGQVFQFDSLTKFIETHPPDGLGTTVDKLFELCSEDSPVLEMLDQAIQADINNQAESTNTSESKKSFRASNSRQAALRRLRRHAEQNRAAAAARKAVLEGKMSVNAALVELGLRKKRITIPKDVDAATEALKRHYNSDELQQLVRRLKA